MPVWPSAARRIPTNAARLARNQKLASAARHFSTDRSWSAPNPRTSPSHCSSSAQRIQPRTVQPDSYRRSVMGGASVVCCGGQRVGSATSVRARRSAHHSCQRAQACTSVDHPRARPPRGSHGLHAQSPPAVAQASQVSEDITSHMVAAASNLTEGRRALSHIRPGRAAPAHRARGTSQTSQSHIPSRGSRRRSPATSPVGHHTRAQRSAEDRHRSTSAGLCPGQRPDRSPLRGAHPSGPARMIGVRPGGAGLRAASDETRLCQMCEARSATGQLDLRRTASWASSPRKP